ncbi:type 1 fimbrial protein [Pseudomonas sp. RW10S2]|nr:type 1 fimbrial protein [Pseudomonas sp. RW10S2]
MYAKVRRVKITTVGLSIAFMPHSKSHACWVKSIVLATLVSSSSAALALDCTLQAETLQIKMPTAITVTRDIANGTLLTQWIVSVANPSFFQCKTNLVAAPGWYYGTAFQPLSMTKSGLTVTGPTGVAYTVWNTNVPGIGIAIGVRAYANQIAWLSWGDLGTASSFLASPWQGNATNITSHSTINNNGGQVQMALVKTGTIRAGTVTGGVMLEAALISAPAKFGPYDIAQNGRKSFLVSSTTINVAACRTADVDVDLGSHKQSEFTGVGSTTPAVAFNVDISACPAGLNAIQYQFTPPTGVLDGSNGVIALSADSSAAGIGVQLKDGNGSPLKYNTPLTLTNYNKTTGGTYSIPLRASYYQISSPVQPGTANSLLTFTMSYQ